MSVSPTFTERPLDFACTKCLTLHETFMKPCHRCGSRRIEHIEFLRQQLGEHWQELIEADRRMVS